MRKLNECIGLGWSNANSWERCEGDKEEEEDLHV